MVGQEAEAVYVEWCSHTQPSALIESYPGVVEDPGLVEGLLERYIEDEGDVEVTGVSEDTPSRILTAVYSE